MKVIVKLDAVTEIVREGAEFLDQFVPGWYDKIAVARLDLSSPTDCVLGQLFGDYGEGKKSLELSDYSFPSCSELGFTVNARTFEHWPNYRETDAFEPLWKCMSICWKNEIFMRRTNHVTQAQPVPALVGEAVK